MRIIGCDLHAQQQTIAMLDDQIGEYVEKVLRHAGDQVRQFYATVPGPVRVGIEATGSMHWFLQLLAELGPGGSSGKDPGGQASQTEARSARRRVTLEATHLVLLCYKT